MHLSPKDFRGWLVLAALVPLVLVGTYLAEPAVLRASYWGDDWRDLPLSARARPLPEDAVASLREAVGDYGRASPVSPATGAEYMLEDLQQVLADLPEAVQALVRERLIGVFLVEGLIDVATDSQNLGMALEVVSILGIGWTLSVDRSPWWLAVPLVVYGLGVGFAVLASWDIPPPTEPTMPCSNRPTRPLRAPAMPVTPSCGAG